MKISLNTRNYLEIGFGIAYLIGSISNFLYVLMNGSKFHERFANETWIPFSKKFIQSVVLPHYMTFAVILLVFQLLVSTAILSRGSFVIYGLLAGAIFSLWAVSVGNPYDSATFFTLAVVQFFLVYLRYMK